MNTMNEPLSTKAGVGGFPRQRAGPPLVLVLALLTHAPTLLQLARNLLLGLGRQGLGAKSIILFPKRYLKL